MAAAGQQQELQQLRISCRQLQADLEAMEQENVKVIIQCYFIPTQP